ncbi:hypothetical protein [Solemya velum gill symbiont]|nr:hypothetical protein [Solemya velum gill symbiont]OOY33997.1 hypothetical protein BOV88_12400 [Solemya velum gill symbiont]OOY36652.1 hypothetical protein BOV89_11535 [Solemya velum gill symbiont]OOY40080.1 hypothetical protein BOV90_05990 [Solemya velum gill symbiont]OOY44662.1 hypothetical protein BOV91_00740 [Solemya velum gill symbiont]OOY45955.1 hypothetical protein BOV92_03995 [Solemya velum gill symbiont]
MRFLHKPIATAIILIMMMTATEAGEADVVDVNVYKTPGGLYTFHVSLLHGDTGWDHYANKWDVIDSDGNVLGTRVLHHPHENEQPFTRSLAGVAIPEGVRSVTIRGYDSVHADGGVTMSVKLP